MHGGGGAQLLLAAMVEPGQCQGVAGASRGSHVGWVATKAVFLEQLSPCACMLNFLVWLHELYENIVQLLSRVQLFVITWTAARQTSLSITVSWSLLKCMSMESVMPSNQLILCRSLLLSSIFPSIRFFSNELALHIISVQFSSVAQSYPTL